ncbi:MAG: hypothetical protein P4M11_04960 [Candidatus Pacebacteria bacterium]|nr:hypothetical protein [Candidatus Paceibacterota bacterium]
MNDHPTDSIQQAVLDKVRAGKVRRRPRLYFVARLIAIAVVSVLLLIMSALVISFVIFSIHESGEQFLLGFGLRGIEVFLVLFPWLYAVITLGLIFLLERLLKGFKFGYRIPVINVFLGAIGISIGLGILISLTPLHSALLGAADKDDLPVLGDAYEHIFTPHDDQGLCRGQVISVGTDSFVIQHNDRDHDPDDGTFNIVIPSGSQLSLPHVGDNVIVFGHPAMNGSIEAQNIQIVPPGQR